MSTYFVVLLSSSVFLFFFCFFCFQAEDGIRDLVRSRGLGDVYKRQVGRAERSAESPGAALVARDRHALQLPWAGEPIEGGLRCMGHR